MDWFFALCAAYGICFGLQNKVTWLHDRSDFLDRMLVCTYCTGFHAGWMTWIILLVSKGKWPGLLGGIGGAVTFAFASAAFCYTVDSAVKWLEANTAEVEEVIVEEEDDA